MDDRDTKSVAPKPSTRRQRGLVSRMVLRASVAAAIVLIGSVMRADAPPSRVEYELKAVFLFNFARFVEWPPEAFDSATQPITIGILGEDPFGGLLADAINGEKIKERGFTIRKLAAPEEARRCQILFVAKTASEQSRAALNVIGSAPVLTVGESDNFARRGGMINFVIVDKTVRFEINPDAAQQAGISISSRLLNLPKAIKVSTDRKEKP